MKDDKYVGEGARRICKIIEGHGVYMGLPFWKDFIRTLLEETPMRKPKVSKEKVETLRDRMMAFRIREFYTPQPRKVILDLMIEEFEKAGVEVEGK